MRRWQLLVGVVSLAQLAWGVLSFVAYARSVGGNGDAAAGWVYSGLGLSGLLTLAVPRSGYLVAAGQLAASAYALWLCVLALLCARVWSVVPILPPVICALIMAVAGTTALLCGVNAVGTLQVARRSLPA